MDSVVHIMRNQDSVHDCLENIVRGQLQTFVDHEHCFCLSLSNVLLSRVLEHLGVRLHSKRTLHSRTLTSVAGMKARQGPPAQVDTLYGIKPWLSTPEYPQGYARSSFFYYAYNSGALGRHSVFCALVDSYSGIFPTLDSAGPSQQGPPPWRGYSIQHIASKTNPALEMCGISHDYEVLVDQIAEPGK
ncbi:hypothetical protein E4U21_002703 [Claviceps maximensis]|nr:hypothetical protein E4U21_002703 [Claviceps maximensis]